MTEKYHNVAEALIGTETYQLVRTEGEPWSREFLDEPPWTDGVPAIVSEPSDTWHQGGLRSRPGLPGSSEYGQNTDCRWPNRILPGPKVYTITLTGSVANPTGFFEALDRLWVCAGRKVYRIDPADDSVVESKDFGNITGVDWQAHMGERWEGDTGFVCTFHPVARSARMWEVTVLGSPDTWAQESGNTDIIAAGTDRLFGVRHASDTAGGDLRNVVSGLDPLIHTNWADVVQCGVVDTRANGLVAYGRTVIVGKPEGVFGVNAEGLGVPLVKRILRDDDNFKGMISMDPYIILPHSRGVYRWMPGYVEAIGIETELLNESIIRGTFTAFVVDGKWLYGALLVGSDTYIMVARDRDEGEAGFGPYVWDTLVHLSSAECHAIWISGKWDPPRLYFGNDYNVSYIRLSSGGGAPDVEGTDYRFGASGKRYTHRYNFGDWGNKDFTKAAITVKGNHAVNSYWELYYSVDGGAYSKLDVDGNDMKLTSNGRTIFYLSQTAVGREIQFYFQYTGGIDEAPISEIVRFEPYAVPQSQKVPLIPITLKLATGVKTDKGVERRTAQEQLNDLIALSESPTAIALEGPWGDISGWLRKLRVTDTAQVGHKETELVVEAVLQRREEE